MKVGFDIDGVVLRTYDLLKDEVIRLFNKEYYYDDDMKICIPGIHNDEVDTVLNDIMIRHANNIKPYEDAEEYIPLIYERIKTPIIFVSARPSWFINETKQVIQNIFTDKIEYTVVCCDHNANKVEYLNNYDIFVEDNSFNIKTLSSHVKELFLINREWNLNIDISEVKNVYKIDSIEDVYKHIL